MSLFSEETTPLFAAQGRISNQVIEIQIMKYVTRKVVLSAGLAVSLSAQNVNDLPIYELQDIIVRGELWESEMQRTTASISVLDEQALRTNGSQHFEDVINTLPNLTWTGGTSRPRYLQIRGVGESSQFEGETPDSTVRFLIDDFDLTGLGTVGNLFDVQQVELLRGPQAGAFGANAAGGVIKIVSTEPTAYWTGQAETSVGDDDLFAAGVAVGGPILTDDPEQLTFRFSLHSLNQDGFRKNIFLDQEASNERDELTSRLKLRWLPNPLWQIEGGLIYAEANNGYDVFTLDNQRTVTFSDEPGRDMQETRGLSLKAKYQGFDAFDLKSTSQYNTNESNYSYDADWGAGFTAPAPFQSGYSGFNQLRRERRVVSEELRLDSKPGARTFPFLDRWTLGTFYHALEEDAHFTYFDRSGSDDAEVRSEYATDTVAIFAQGAHHFTDAIRLIVGLRYEHHAVDFQSQTLDNSDLDFDGNPDLLPSGEDDRTDDLWGGKITLERDLSSENTIFAALTRGYKAGGANSGVFRTAQDPTVYENETLWNYELGLRSRWLEGKLRTQITGFYLHRDAAQLRDSDGAGGFFRYFTSNQGKAEHYGLESEAGFYLTEAWSLNASLGLLETNLKLTDRDLSNAPSYNYSARIDYRPSEGFFASTEVSGKEAYFESNSHQEKRSAYTVINGSIGYRWKDWTFTLWARNLFDTAYEDRVFFFDNFNPVDSFVPTDRRYEAPAAPRSFGVTAKYFW